MSSFTRSQLKPISDLLADMRKLLELVDPVAFQKMGTVTQSQLYPISDLLADTKELLELREPVALQWMGFFQ